jgi:hypothetical protein
VRGGIADFAPLQNGQLAANTVRGVLVRAEYMQSPDTLAVQSSVLCKALRRDKKHLINFSCVWGKADITRTWQTNIGTPRDSKYRTYGTIFRFESRKEGRREGKETYRPRIPIQIATRESLVRTIKKGKMSLLQKDLRKLVPLVLRWVHPSGIMRAGMQEEHGAVWSGLERVEKALKVEPEG